MRQIIVQVYLQQFLFFIVNYQFGVEKRYTRIFSLHLFLIVNNLLLRNNILAGMFIDKFCSLLCNDDEDESVNNDEWDDERDGQRLDFVFSSDEEFSGDANGERRCKQLLKEIEVSSSEDERSTLLEKRKIGI